jgi:hypothetical protein
MDSRPSDLRITDVLRRATALYREHFRLLIPAAFWLCAALAIPTGLLIDPPTGPVPSMIGLVAGGATGVVWVGMVAKLLSDTANGEDSPSVVEFYGSVGPVLVPLVLAALICGIGLAVGLFLLVIPALYLGTIWVAVAPAITIEGRGTILAFRRSRQLVRGFGRRVFVLVVVAASAAVIGGVIHLAIAEVIAGGPFLDPGGDALRIVLAVLISSVTSPFTGLVFAVLYFRLLELNSESGVTGMTTVDPG